jgi:hypothetical protein
MAPPPLVPKDVTARLPAKVLPVMVRMLAPGVEEPAMWMAPPRDR